MLDQPFPLSGSTFRFRNHETNNKLALNYFIYVSSHPEYNSV